MHPASASATPASKEVTIGNRAIQDLTTIVLPTLQTFGFGGRQTPGVERFFCSIRIRAESHGWGITHMG